MAIKTDFPARSRWGKKARKLDVKCGCFDHLRAAGVTPARSAAGHHLLDGAGVRHRTDTGGVDRQHEEKRQKRRNERRAKRKAKKEKSS